MAKNYIHSTASADMTYPVYAGGTDRPTKIKEIVIKGRANVIDPRTLFTPTGAVTEVSDADLELLKKNAAFQRHVARGFMRVMQDSELNTNVKGLYCLGDSSGWTRGLMMASVMGVLMGRKLAE